MRLRTFLLFFLSCLSCFSWTPSACAQTTTLTINSSTGLINVPSGVTPNFTALHVGGVSLGAPAWSSIAGTPTTLSGYGVTSVPWSVLTGAPNTLGGYGITDAVSNTALSTWVGTSNITTLGTVTIGTWQGTVIDVPHGGTGTASPGLVAGSNVTITGTWPNQTINASSGGGGGGGGSATLYKVADDAARFSGTYNAGDFVLEVGRPAIFTITVNDDSGGSEDLASFVFNDQYGNTFGVWLNINSDGPPSGWAYTYQIPVSASQNDTAVTIGGNILAALNANSNFTSQFSAVFDGVNTLTITAATNFNFSGPSTSVIGYNVIQTGEAPSKLFEVIDSTTTGSEAGFAALPGTQQLSSLGLIATDGNNTLSTIPFTPAGYAPNPNAVGIADSNGIVPLHAYTVATLPAGNVGEVAYVTDATLTIATGLGVAPTGGGSNTVPVFYDGAGWKMF